MDQTNILEGMKQYMWLLTAFLSALTFGLAGFMMKVSSMKQGSMLYLLWGLYFSGTLGFMWWMYYTDTVMLRLPILISGIVIGIGSAFGNLLFMKALEQGPASLTSPIVNSNIVFTLLMSILFFNETLSLPEVIGVTLLILAVMMLPIDPNESLRIQNKKWYGLVTVATVLFFLRNGGLKITEEMDLPNSPVLFFSYLLGLLWFSIEIFRKGETSFSSQETKVGLAWGIGSGFFSFAGLQLYAHSLAEGPASIVAPVFSINSLVVAILSILIYRERLSLFQTICLLLLFTSFIFIRSAI